MRVLSVAVGPAITDDERADLLRIFADDFDAVERGRQFSVDWDTIALVAKDAGTIVGTANAVIVLGARLNEWRRRLIESRRTPSAHIQSGGDTLDLATATDEEVEEWLRRRRDQREVG